MRIYVSFFFFSFWIHYLFVHRSCDHLVIANIVLVFDIYMMMMLLSFFFSLISPCVVSILSIYTCFLCMESLFLFHTKMPR